MKSIVLLSSGLDSTINLYHYHQRGEVNLALTIRYGQRSVEREVHHASQQCRELGIEHQVVELDFFKKFQSSSLFSKSAQDVPKVKRDHLDDLQVNKVSAQSVWVPNRNGVFLNLAACFAEERSAEAVVTGFNKEEAQTFPDNSEEFLSRLNESLSYSTRTGVKVYSHTLRWTKREIVEYGLKIGVNFSGIWPCYHGFENPCGTCESCQRYARAIDGLVADPRFI